MSEFNLETIIDILKTAQVEVVSGSTAPWTEVVVNVAGQTVTLHQLVQALEQHRLVHQLVAPPPGTSVKLSDARLAPGYYWYRPADEAEWEVVHVGDGQEQRVARFTRPHGVLQRGEIAGSLVGPIFWEEVDELEALRERVDGLEKQRRTDPGRGYDE